MQNYLFSYSLASKEFSFTQVEAFVSSNKYVDEWAYAFPGSYFLKTSQDFESLWRSFDKFMNGNSFVIAEISLSHLKTNGTLPQSVWAWLKDNSQNALLAITQMMK